MMQEDGGHNHRQTPVPKLNLSSARTPTTTVTTTTPPTDHTHDNTQPDTTHSDHHTSTTTTRTLQPPPLTRDSELNTSWSNLTTLATPRGRGLRSTLHTIKHKATHFRWTDWGWLRGCLAVPGGILFWIGGWNALDVYLLPENVWYDIACTIIGTIILFATGTFKLQAGVTSHDIPEVIGGDSKEQASIERDGRWHYFWNTHAGLYVRSLVALLGSVILWKGAYKILDEWLGETTLVRDLIYLAIGLFLLTITDTLSGNVGLGAISRMAWATDEDNHATQQRTRDVSIDMEEEDLEDTTARDHDEEQGHGRVSSHSGRGSGSSIDSGFHEVSLYNNTHTIN